MVVWLVAAPIVILLLALAGANWKTFHLAYAKHLIASTDRYEQAKGIEMVLETHLRKGMPLEEVRRLLAPAKVAEFKMLSLSESPPVRGFIVFVKGSDVTGVLGFDENDRLRYAEFMGEIAPGKFRRHQPIGL